MKHIAASVSFLLVATIAQATTHVITCQNGANHFLPVTVNAMVGDTIHWTWVSGNHIVGPINASDIPSGASMWNGTINTGNHTYDYVLAVPGTFHYVCHPATPHGEDGFINVTEGTTSVQTPVAEANVLTLYPDPFISTFTVEATGANEIVFHNALGEKVASFPLRNNQTKVQADMGHLPSGIYFCSALKNGIVISTRRVVRE